MATQYFKRNLFLNLYRKGGKNVTLVCFLLPLKRERKKCMTLAASFLHLETPGLPACYFSLPPHLVVFIQCLLTCLTAEDTIQQIDLETLSLLGHAY